MRNRRFGLAVVAAALALLIAWHPDASLRIAMHDTADLSPRRVHAALDTGLVTLSVLVTWTADRAIR